MLAIRYQRTGRKGHAQFRIIVQDARKSPKSGNVVARLGHYNPHSKDIVLDKEKAKFYLDHGAQPSDTVARMLKAQGVKLPDWVSIVNTTKRKVKNPEKLRKNRPAGAEAPPSKEEKAAEAAEEAEAAKAENLAEQPHPEQSQEQPAEEQPAVSEENPQPEAEATEPEQPAEETPKE